MIAKPARKGLPGALAGRSRRALSRFSRQIRYAQAARQAASGCGTRMAWSTPSRPSRRSSSKLAERAVSGAVDIVGFAFKTERPDPCPLAGPERICPAACEPVPFEPPIQSEGMWCGPRRSTTCRPGQAWAPSDRLPQAGGAIGIQGRRPVLYEEVRQRTWPESNYTEL